MNSNYMNNPNTNQILQNINGLFAVKNQAYISKNNPNPFNMGNYNIMNFNNKINYNQSNQVQYQNYQNNQNPINIVAFKENFNNNINENNDINVNLNINNELMAQKSSFGSKIDMGQSPIFDNGSNSNIFGKNSNEGYKLYEELVEKDNNSIDKKVLDNYKNNNNENLTNVKQSNNNLNFFSPQNIEDLHFIKNKFDKKIPISNFNPINNIINNNNENKESDKKSVSEDIRNKLEKIKINEMSQDWFHNEKNYDDPLYFEKLKKFEIERMGIKPLKLSDFLIGKKLGSGQFGRVYLVKYKPTQFICCLKIINKKEILKQSDNCINQLRREIEIQSHLHHPNILSLYNFFWDNKNIYLVIEYAPEGELFRLIHIQEKGRFSEKKAAFYIYQVCDALEYIQKKHILHRDIKPENILLSNEVIKLADFGWGIHQKSNKFRPTFCGTLEYMPPEVIDYQPHIASSDLWCLGILIYELCSGDPPFTGNNREEIFSQIKFKNEEYPSYFSEEVKDLIGKLIKKTPKDRITIQEVKKHPWIIKNLYKK